MFIYLSYILSTSVVVFNYLSYLFYYQQCRDWHRWWVVRHRWWFRRDPMAHSRSRYVEHMCTQSHSQNTRAHTHVIMPKDPMAHSRSRYVKHVIHMYMHNEYACTHNHIHKTHAHTRTWLCRKDPMAHSRRYVKKKACAHTHMIVPIQSVGMFSKACTKTHAHWHLIHPRRHPMAQSRRRYVCFCNAHSHTRAHILMHIFCRGITPCTINVHTYTFTLAHTTQCTPHTFTYSFLLCVQNIWQYKDNNGRWANYDAAASDIVEVIKIK